MSNFDKKRNLTRKDIFIFETASGKDVLKKLDKTAEKVLLVVDGDDKLLGTITDGDIRRHILKGKGLDSDVRDIYNRYPTYIEQGKWSMDVLRKVFIEKKIELIPVVDENRHIVDFISWSQAFTEGEIFTPHKGNIDVPVVIMAGGKGSRLEPFTKIIPKPLIPIGDKPIIEIIVDEFRKQGGQQYYISLNHKGEMIEWFFNSLKKDYNIEYIREDDFLGTAGSLKLLEEKIDDTFIVSNCDVIVRADFSEVLNLHRKHQTSLTILSSIQHYRIPYGVIQFKDKGVVTNIFEKPEYTFPINTGVYVMSRKALQFIPDKSYFDMTDLIKTLISKGEIVSVYPVNASDYIDIGQWEEYKKVIDKLEVFR